MLRSTKTDPQILSHVKHIIKTFNILRENRNLIEHSLPNETEEGEYLGQLWKLDRRGKPQQFIASEQELKKLLDDLKRTKIYTRRMAMMIKSLDRESEDGQLILSSFGKPPLPRKLNPHQPD